MNPYEIVPLRAFSDNYIWTLHDATHAIVVDPGDARPVFDYLAAKKLKLAAIVITHHHADHIGGVKDLIKGRDIPVYGPHDPRVPDANQRLKEGDSITLPHFGVKLTVIEVPGHTSSHIAFYGDGMLFCGDTLFAAGCGRLFEGTPAQMHDSLSKFMRLPDQTRVYCAHEYTLANIRFAKAAEPANRAVIEWESRAQAMRQQDQPTVPSTIALERAANPFVRCAEPGVIATASQHAGKPLADPVSVLAAIREWKNKF
ncbi:MAG TPA: hydroxyacylglutathione hydrolase [Burkholderiales bacterium]|nr:hydroxyacylglutathione hydrolase [Burkholderiales bacterium]